jgi:EAL domain-containing protein (putative c-di-GMP-specific phosphodiesterase class I)
MAEAAVDSMLETSHAVGAKVVAEWVESEAVRRRLIEKGFELGQGFHLHAPQPLASLG